MLATQGGRRRRRLNVPDTQVLPKLMTKPGDEIHTMHFRNLRLSSLHQENTQGGLVQEQVIVKVNGVRTVCLDPARRGSCSAAQVLDEVLHRAKIPRSGAAQWQLWSSSGSRWLDPDESIRNGAWIEARLRGGLRGGKGGFGNTLRASARRGGSGTTDFSACRDLNGRRLRHVNNEVRLRLWREEQAQREQLRREGKELAPGDSKLLNTPSGIKNWFLSVPSWADHVPKERKNGGGRERRLCTDWARAQVSKAKKPDNAPPWYGCPRGRACPFSHRSEDLTPARYAEFVAEKRAQARAAIDEKMRTYTAQIQQSEASMSSSIMEGMRRSKQASVQARASAKADAQALEDDVNQDLDTAENINGDRIQCLCGDLGVGDFGEVQGRADFSTAVVPSVAVTADSWYFEVTLVAEPAGSLQIGCATELFEATESSEDGVGDLPLSWALDPVRGKFFDQGCELEATIDGIPLRDAAVVREGCTIGCHLDVSKRQLYFAIDGRRVSIADKPAGEPLHLLTSAGAASSLSSSTVPESHFFYPALSMDAGTFVRINLGEQTFRCEPLDRRVHGLCGDSNLRLLCAGSSFYSEQEAEVVGSATPCTNNAEAVENDSAETTSSSSQQTSSEEELGPVDLDAAESAASLERFGLVVLKKELETRNLKCGGTLEERARRLFSVKGLAPEEIDPSLRPNKKRKRR